MTELSEKQEIVKSHCNSCLGERNHHLLFLHKSKWSDDECDIYGDDVYQLLKCCGCEAIILRHQSRFSEDWDEDGLVVTTKYYPPAISRKKPSWFRDIISFGGTKFSLIEEMIDEVYVAMQNGSNRLATMGIRAVIETVMIDKVTDHGTFAANLDEMCKQGYISAKQRERLEVVLDAGHATIHRDYCPKPRELNNILDLCESLIESLYIHEVKTKRLSEKIPPRPPRPPKKKKDSKLEAVPAKP
ncbi:MAG TPA: hypothetical protein DCZ75_05755 [Geobacter sp.]|nr:hypothetical protein [Geobacter sp.]